MEQWKHIAGFEGSYEVSNTGLVKSLARGTIMKPGTNKGYRYVILTNGSVKKFCQVHRLVANAFIPNPEKKEQVNHKDFDRANNCISNLEWTTRLENLAHFFKSGRKKKFTRVTARNSILSESEVREIWSLRGTASHRLIGKRFNVGASTVGEILRNESWKHLLLNQPV